VRKAVFLEPVLQRDDEAVAREAAGERPQRLEGVRRLHGEQHLSERPVRLIGRCDRCVDPCLPITGEAQATRAHRRDVVAVRLDEAHVVACFDQRDADDGADRAGADDGELAHRFTSAAA
jgi:hypothetical protein